MWQFMMGFGLGVYVGTIYDTEHLYQSFKK